MRHVALQQRQAPLIRIGMCKGGPVELKNVNLNLLDGELVEQAIEEADVLRPLPKRGVDQIDPECSDGLLLKQRRPVPQIGVQQNLAWRRTGFRFKSKSHPSVLLVGSLVVARRHRVRERKE